jgi:phosphoglycerate dehydrogenase-like enzyme
LLTRSLYPVAPNRPDWVAKSREEFFAEADILSLHLLLHKDTRGIVGCERELAPMKPGALWSTTARSGLIAKGLEEALKARRPGFATVDVYDKEPVGADEPLSKMANVTCTLHLGYVTRESYEEYFAVVDDIVRLRRAPSHVESGDAWRRRDDANCGRSEGYRHEASMSFRSITEYEIEAIAVHMVVSSARHSRAARIPVCGAELG